MRTLRKIRYLWKKFFKQIRRSRDHFIQFIADVLYDRNPSPQATVVASLLVPFSYIFWIIIDLRIWLYRKRILRSQSLGCHVIVVGNLTMGGTGKTPVAEYLAKLLLSMGRKPAIISRGYKRRDASKGGRFWRWLTHAPELPPSVVSDGERLLMDSEHAGDEPYMLAKNLKHVAVVVDRDRVKAGNYAIKKLGADVLILDDGYQYLKLKPTLRIALVDRGNPFGNEFLLPRGILREPISHLDRAGCMLLTKSNGMKDPDLIRTLQQANPTACFAECRHAPCYLESQEGGKRLPLESLRGKHVAIFCGIASPDHFETFIQSLGAMITYRKRYLDHHRFTETELASIDERARQADFLITTEKDVVRITPDFQFHTPLYYLRVEVNFLQNEQGFRSLIAETLGERLR